MLTDLDIALLLQSQYDGVQGVFDVSSPYGVVSWALKHYTDCDVICFEGSHDLPDWQRDFEAVMAPVRKLGGVHAGFYDGLPEVLNAVTPVLSKENPIKVCGHSLGGGEAHIFTGMLANSGFTQLETITFGSPLPGNQQLCDLIAPFPNRSYWNYRDRFHCDLVGTVPDYIPLLAPYVFPRKRILIDAPPALNDSWGIFARHHLFLYTQALKEKPNG